MKFEKGINLDFDGLAACCEGLLDTLFDGTTWPGITETPRRMAEAYAELLSGYEYNPKQILETQFEADHQELVLQCDIQFYSLCEHHLLPFFGVAHVGYIPAEHGKVVGLSKLARLVDCFSKRLQLQEQLGGEIVDSLMEELEPVGAICVIEAQHLCMSCRGVKKPDARTITSHVRGVFKDSAAARNEAMQLIAKSR